VRITRLLALAKVAQRVLPGGIERVRQAQLPELVLPHAVVIHKRYVMACAQTQTTFASMTLKFSMRSLTHGAKGCTGH